MPTELTPKRACRGFAPCCALLAALGCPGALAADGTTRDSTIEAGLGYERARLPGNEKMGLAAGWVLFPLGGQ